MSILRPNLAPFPPVFDTHFPPIFHLFWGLPSAARRVGRARSALSSKARRCGAFTLALWGPVAYVVVAAGASTLLGAQQRRAGTGHCGYSSFGRVGTVDYICPTPSRTVHTEKSEGSGTGPRELGREWQQTLWSAKSQQRWTVLLPSNSCYPPTLLDPTVD